MAACLKMHYINSMKKLPHEKVGLPELAYNIYFGQGYREGLKPLRNCVHRYPRGTKEHKAWSAGRRASKHG